MLGSRIGALAAFAAFAVVCVACGGGTAGTGSDDEAFEAAAGSDTTTIPEPETADASDTTTTPEPETALEQPDDGGKDRDGAGEEVAAGTTVPEPQNAEPTVGVIAAIEVAAGEAAAVDLSSFFGDPDGDELVYEATSSDAAVAVVSVSGSSVEVEGTGEGTATVTVTASDPSDLSVQQSFDVTVRRVVVSLDAPEPVLLTEMGETRELWVSANYSDGSKETVDATLVQWQSSDPWVASVAEGLVNAVGGGNAVITATHEGRTLEVPVSVRISTKSARSVRVIYAAPSDREFLADYSEAIHNAIVDVQSWYRRELGGLTFSLSSAAPEECQLDQPHDFYARYSWQRVLDGVQHCAPVQGFSSDHVWVVYPDVVTECSPTGSAGDGIDGYGELGRGGPGLTMLSGYDLEGLNEPGDYIYCGEGPYPGPLERWIGGLGHELAHAFGLLHPPGCDAGLPSCDYESLMHLGFVTYPHTYLRADDKETLLRSPFIGTRSSSGLLPPPPPDASRVTGSVAASDGSAVEEIRVSLVGEDFWAWAATDADGTFEIAVPDGATGSAVVSVHASETAACRWLGYYEASGGLTVLQHQAEPLAVGGSDISGVDITLPAGPDEMCGGQRFATGTVLGPDSEPVEGVWVGDYVEWSFTARDGAFNVPLTRNPYYGSVLYVEDPECGNIGYYGPDGFATAFEQASHIWAGGVDATGIEIRLPANVDELCEQQGAR